MQYNTNVILEYSTGGPSTHWNACVYLFLTSPGRDEIALIYTFVHFYHNKNHRFKSSSFILDVFSCIGFPYHLTYFFWTEFPYLSCAFVLIVWILPASHVC